MSTQNVVDDPVYKNLCALKQTVEAVYYLASITPLDDEDYSIKSVLAERLKTDFDKLYIDTIQTLAE